MRNICPICNYRDYNFLYKRNFIDTNISFINSYDVVACKKCGFIFATNIPSQKEFDNYYFLNFKYEYKENNYLAPKEVNKLAEIIVNFIEPHIENKHIDILEFGCSTGTLLAEFKKRGYNNLLGVDPSKNCVNAVKNLYSINCQNSSLFDFNLNKKFDLIILVAVLEHIEDLKGAMEKIKTFLKPDGLLFLNIPNIELFYKYSYGPFSQFHSEHINYFSKNSIKNLLNLYGYNILKLTSKITYRLPSIGEPDIFILSKSCGIQKNIYYDNIGELFVNKYIEVCKEEENKIKDKIEKRKDKNIIIWGVGDCTRWLLSSNINLPSITYFVDSNFHYIGKKFYNKEIKLPKEIDKNFPIYVSSYYFREEIINNIKQMNLKNEIIVL